LSGPHSGHSDGLSGQCQELDLVSQSALVNVNHCADVARLQPLGGDILSQDDASMFMDHRLDSKAFGSFMIIPS
jgi:hypothetical protein